MREIKFRGKCLRTNDWVYGSLIIKRNEYYIGYISDISGIWSVIQVEPKTVGQYTGLKDKDGREIYEGDLVKNSRFGSNQLMHVKWSDAIEEVSSDGVEWTRQKPGFVFEKISKGMTYVFVASKDLEVIGNIYENRELLEEKE